MDIAMTWCEIEFLSAFLRSASTYLEFGAGGSTVLAGDLMSGPITSVDSSPDWLRRVGEAISKPERLVMHFADIGPTREWGFPSPDSRALFPDYHQGVWRVTAGSAIDIFLIDGRFRVASFCQAAVRANDTAIIFIHDYNIRPGYHVIERIAKKIGCIDQLAAFRPLPGRAADAYQIISDYAYTPE